jgi:hypothetical protein
VVLASVPWVFRRLLLLSNVPVRQRAKNPIQIKGASRSRDGTLTVLYAWAMNPVKPSDDLSTYLAELLEGSYDCMDRITVNAFFPLGQTGGGIRSWWRNWKGSDKGLSDAGMKALAGEFGRRLNAWCRQNNIPFIDCLAGDDKRQIAQGFLPKDPAFQGVFAVLVGRASAPVWRVQLSPKGKILNLAHQDPWPHVQHYYFQIKDREWGHVMVRMCGYPPFGAQVVFNGHEWVRRQARHHHYRVVQEGNCFVAGSNFPAIDLLSVRLLGEELAPSLQAACERWLYSACLCFGLRVEDQTRSRFRYRFSVWELEYSRNLLFRDGQLLDQVYQKLLDRTRGPLDLKALKTIFGVRHRQAKSKKQRPGRSEPEMSKEVQQLGDHDVTVFTIRWGNLVLKMYDKGERVLRIEVKVLNTKALRVGRLLDKLPQMLARMQEMLVRFLGVVQAAHISFLDAGQFESWAEPSQRGGRRLAGLDLNKARNRAVVRGLVALSSAPEGFTVPELAEEVRQRLHCSPEEYSTRRAAYDLAKARGKGLSERVPGRSRYQCQPQQLRTLCAYVVLREEVLKPLLAGVKTDRLHDPPKQMAPLDRQYVLLHAHMNQTFELLGLAA